MPDDCVTPEELEQAKNDVINAAQGVIDEIGRLNTEATETIALSQGIIAVLFIRLWLKQQELSKVNAEIDNLRETLNQYPDRTGSIDPFVDDERRWGYADFVPAPVEVDCNHG